MKENIIINNWEYLPIISTLLYEPLEQFEITKIGYEYWYKKSWILNILEFYNTLVNNSNNTNIENNFLILEEDIKKLKLKKDGIPPQIIENVLFLYYMGLLNISDMIQQIENSDKKDNYKELLEGLYIILEIQNELFQWLKIELENLISINPNLKVMINNLNSVNPFLDLVTKGEFKILFTNIQLVNNIEFQLIKKKCLLAFATWLPNFLEIIESYNEDTIHAININLKIFDIKLPIYNFSRPIYLNSSCDFFDSILWQPNLYFTPLWWGINLNSTIYFFILLITILIFLLIPIVNNFFLIANGWQLFLENLYKFVAEMLETQVGKEAQKFFPYIFSIFIFILTSNILGMSLFSFTLTSHIMVTFTLGVSTFIGLTILGFVIQKLKFLNLFLPQGIPIALLPMLVIIEVISYFSRALSLSIRLFANLMSGHTLLHILAFFSSKLFKYKFIIGFISFILILAIVALEFCIAILQAYVFAILICIYLNDSYHASH